MKHLIKYTLAIAVMFALMTTSAKAFNVISGSISATTNATNNIWVGAARVLQITVLSSTANTIKFYDTTNTTLLYTNQAYTNVINYTLSVTNLTTNGVYEFSPSNIKYLIQTNIYVNANMRSNVLVAASGTNQTPVAIQLDTFSNLPASAENLDLNFVNGITVRSTNAFDYVIYTR